MPKRKKKPVYRKVKGRTVRVLKKRGKKRVPRKNLGYLQTGGLYGRRTEEKKYFDTPLAEPWAIGSAFGIVATVGGANDGNLLRIAQGTGANDRIGLKIVLKSVQLRCTLFMDAYANPVQPVINSVVRIVCFMDTQTNGALPLMAQLWETPGNYFTAPNIANATRFTILKEWLLEMNNPTLVYDQGSGNFGSSAWFWQTKWNKKFDIPIEYSSTTGAIAEIRTNSIWLCTIASSNNQMKLQGRVRVRYTDM